MSQHLSLAVCGKAPEGQPRSEPDSGNPTVRDRRGARGNVAHGGIVHLKVRAPRLYPDPDEEGIETIKIKTTQTKSLVSCRPHGAADKAASLAG